MVIKREKKKLTLFLTLIIFGVLILTLVSASASDVAYILKNDRVYKQEILDVFSELGLTVDLIEDDDVLKYNFADYRLVFVDDMRLRKTKNIPIYNYPSVIMNKYYGEEWGLTDYDGISQLASNSPLNVRMFGTNNILQVYTQATEGSISLPYYFLDDHNKANMISVARTYTGDGDNYDFGDVIAIANPGTHLINGKISQGKMCFYGIAKTKYWTNNARQLFKDCVGSVLIQCEKDSDCDDSNDYTQDRCVNPGTVNSYCENEPIECLDESDCGVDGVVGDLFCNGASGNDVYRNFLDFTCNNPGQTNSFCSNETTPEFVEACADICINGACEEIECFDDSECGEEQLINDYCAGDEVWSNYSVPVCLNDGTTDSECITEYELRFKEECVHGCADGVCLENIECSFDSDCGQEFVGENYCVGNDIYQNTTNPVCNNPGLASSFCSNETTSQLIEECSNLCINGECIDIECYTNEDCDDLNSQTFDQCVNPGTPESYCINTEMNCISNLQCGVTGFINHSYCWNDDVYKNYQNSTCSNAGTLDSNCNIDVFPILLQDCDDGNGYTFDYCFQGIEAMCKHELIECFNDLNCGQEQLIENFCIDDEVWSNYSVPACLNDGTTDSECITEYELRFKEKCAEGCSNGECLAQDIICENNLDCGVDGWTGNEYCSNNDVVRDWKNNLCENPGQTNSFCADNGETKLIQDCGASSCGSWSGWSCSDNDTKTRQRNCNDRGCSVGDCFDNARIETDTQDCQQGQICQSGECAAQPPTPCRQNSDCGADDWIGDEYCSNNDVYQDWKTHICNYPRSRFPFCSDFNEARLKENCGEDETQIGAWQCADDDTRTREITEYSRGCSSGNCFENFNIRQETEDCSVGEVCQGGGCVKIECYNNLQCGIDNWIGGRYCIGDNAYRDFREFVCNNPGLSSSFCDNDDEARLIENCGQDYYSEWEVSCLDADTKIMERNLYDAGCSAGNCFENVIPENITEDCPQGQGCDGGECSPILECTTNSDCEHLENDYCDGSVLRQDRGVCVDNKCKIEKVAVEDCALRNGLNNECGLMDWSCSEELNQAECVLTNIIPDDSHCNDFCAGNFLNQGRCNSITFNCDYIQTNCDDGLFCDGQESCSNAQCQNGISPVVNDDVECTVDSCDEINDRIIHNANDLVCSDGLFCNGAEYCDVDLGCQTGQAIICNSHDITAINTCNNNPDANPLTLDSRNPFISQCSEEIRSCTIGNDAITHECKLSCGAECEINDDCVSTECDNLDGCVGDNYYDYQDKENNCLSCECEENLCEEPIIILNDSRCQQECICESWVNSECGGGACSSEQRLQTRTCNPDGCETEERCVEDSTCDVSIWCSSDAECGTDGWTGNKYCKNSDVWQDWKNNICRYPRTPMSYCSSFNEAKFKQDCGENEVEEGGWYCASENERQREIKSYARGCLIGACFENVSPWVEKENCPQGQKCEGGECVDVSCICENWVKEDCGAGSCSETQRLETRSCSPVGCGAEQRCVEDSSCGIIINNAPKTKTILPLNGNSCGDKEILFLTVYTDKDGIEDLKYNQFMISEEFSNTGNVFVSYNQNTNKVWIRDDGGEWIGDVKPGTPVVLENSQFSLNVGGMSVYPNEYDKNDLVIIWPITFKNFVGSKNTWLYVKDNSDATDGWNKHGTWDIEIKPKSIFVVVHDDDTEKGASCPENYIERGRMHVGKFNNDIYGVDYFGNEIKSGWMGLCVVDDSALLVNRNVPWPENDCPSGYEPKGGILLGGGDSRHAISCDYNGRCSFARQGWSEICVKNNDGETLYVNHKIDCEGATHILENCPQGYELTGQAHVYSGSCGGSMEQFNYNGEFLDSGWIGVCGKGC